SGRPRSVGWSGRSKAPPGSAEGATGGRKRGRCSPLARPRWRPGWRRGRRSAFLAAGAVPALADLLAQLPPDVLAAGRPATRGGAAVAGGAIRAHAAGAARVGLAPVAAVAGLVVAAQVGLDLVELPVLVLLIPAGAVAVPVVRLGLLPAAG